MEKILLSERDVTQLIHASNEAMCNNSGLIDAHTDHNPYSSRFGKITKGQSWIVNRWKREVKQWRRLKEKLICQTKKKK